MLELRASREKERQGMSWKDQLAEFNRYNVHSNLFLVICTLYLLYNCHRLSRRKLASCEEVPAKDTTPQMDEVSGGASLSLVAAKLSKLGETS